MSRTLDIQRTKQLQHVAFICDVLGQSIFGQGSSGSRSARRDFRSRGSAGQRRRGAKNGPDFLFCDSTHALVYLEPLISAVFAPRLFFDIRLNSRKLLLEQF